MPDCTPLDALLDRDRFEHWLEQRPDTAFPVKHTCYCPAAEYLREHGYPFAEVLTDTIDLDGCRLVLTPFPDWLETFVVEVDFGKQETILGAEALLILRAIPREEAGNG